MAIFLAFFLYRDGPAIAKRVEAALERLAGDQTRHLVALTGDVRLAAWSTACSAPRWCRGS